MSSPEFADVVRESARVHGVESELPVFEPGGEGAKIGAVRALRCLGESAVLEEALDCPCRAHHDIFASTWVSPSNAGEERDRGIGEACRRAYEKYPQEDRVGNEDPLGPEATVRLNHALAIALGLD